jgi:REP element-mobilizing transposase RayT
MRGFKTFSARQINKQRNTPGNAVWQRGYYDHIIRGENSLQKIRDYIESNPLKWEFDRDNPDFITGGL